MKRLIIAAALPAFLILNSASFAGEQAYAPQNGPQPPTAGGPPGSGPGDRPAIEVGGKAPKVIPPGWHNVKGQLGDPDCTALPNGKTRCPNHWVKD